MTPRDPWVDVGELDCIPRRGARVVVTDGGEVAIFRTADDQVFALDDRCPHRAGPLSQGLVHGERVTCPLHGTEVCLSSGRVQGRRAPSDPVRRHATRVVEGRVQLVLTNGPSCPDTGAL